MHCKVFYPVPTQYLISAGYVKCTYIMPQGQNSQFSRMRLWVTFPFQPCCYTVKLNLFIRVSKAILVCDQSQNGHVDIWTLCMWPLVCVSLGQAVHEPIPWALWKFMIGPTLTAVLDYTDTGCYCGKGSLGTTVNPLDRYAVKTCILQQ